MIILITLAEIGQPRVFSSYDAIASTYENGLDPIVAALVGNAPSWLLQPLSDAVYDYIKPLYFDTTPPLDQEQALKSVMGNVYNAYVNPGSPFANNFSSSQMRIIGQIMGTIKNMPVGIAVATSNIFQMLGQQVSKLDAQDQAPLLTALAIAGRCNQYLMGQIASPSTDWANFLNANDAINYININRWVNAAFIGALIGFTQSTRVVPTNAAQGTGVSYNLVTTIAGALTLTFGEIVYGWVKQPSFMTLGR